MSTNETKKKTEAVPRGRVLVAEDDPEMRRVLVEMLAMDGHETYDVSDGAALLRELAGNHNFHFRKVDIVVADVRMPLCTGIDALEAIRGLPLDIPFVLLSAFADQESHARVKKLGAILLDKPVSMIRFRQVVADEIRRARAQRGSVGVGEEEAESDPPSPLPRSPSRSSIR